MFISGKEEITFLTLRGMKSVTISSKACGTLIPNVKAELNKDEFTKVLLLSVEEIVKIVRNCRHYKGNAFSTDSLLLES